MQCTLNGDYVFMFLDLHQDPGGAVLDVLQLLNVLARNPEKDSVTIVQPRGDKGMDQLFYIWCG